LLAACALLLGGCMSLPMHNINVLGGSRMLDQSEWEPVDSQTMVGIEVDTYKPRDGLGAELGFQYSRDDSSTAIANQGTADVEGENYEVYAGARKTFPLFEDRLFPYLGMGLAYVLSDFDVGLPSGSADDTNGSLGVYIRGGAYWNFAGNWHLGLDVRRMIGTDIDLLDVESDADYMQVALFVGFAF
jgi:opacity protein-like surface antigen